MAIVNLSSPWVEYYRKLQELFRLDHEVNVVLDANEFEISVYVDNQSKADALTDILLPEVEFGNVKLKITVIPSNNVRDGNVNYFKRRPLATGDLPVTKFEKYRRAFDLQNKAVGEVVPAVGIGGVEVIFVVFEPVVAQYYNDDIGDLFGLRTTVYEDLARDVCVGEAGVFFCTVPRVEENRDRN